MANEIKKKLEDEIGEVLAYMEEISPDNDHYEQVLKNLDTLYRLKIDEDATFIDKLKNVSDNKTKILIELGGLGVVTIFNAIWMRKGFRFEENGTYYSTTFRWWWSKLKNKFK